MNDGIVDLDTCTESKLLELLSKALQDAFVDFSDLHRKCNPTDELGELYARFSHAKAQQDAAGKPIKNLGAFLYQCARNVWRDMRRSQQRSARLSGSSDILAGLETARADEPITVCASKEAVERAGEALHRSLTRLRPKDQAIASDLLDHVSLTDPDALRDRERLARRHKTTVGGARQALHRINAELYLSGMRELGDEGFRLFRRPNLSGTDLLLSFADAAENDAVVHASVAIILYSELAHLALAELQNPVLAGQPDRQEEYNALQDKAAIHAKLMHDLTDFSIPGNWWPDPGIRGLIGIAGCFGLIDSALRRFHRPPFLPVIQTPLQQLEELEPFFARGMTGLTRHCHSHPVGYQSVCSFVEARWRHFSGEVRREATGPVSAGNRSRDTPVEPNVSFVDVDWSQVKCTFADPSANPRAVSI